MTLKDVKPVITTVKARLDVTDCPGGTQDTVQTETEVNTKQPVKRKKKGYSKNGVKLGRPTNEMVQAVKHDARVLAEYKQRMLASPKSAKVLEAVLDAASDKDHKNFTAAAKLVMDRLLPVSSFDAKDNTGKASVSITITGVDGAKTVIGTEEEEEAIDAEYTEEDS
jgi:hypothetical protein